MRTVLLALLFVLSLPAVALADVDKPGYSEIRQDGTTVTWVLGIPSDQLASLAGGDTKESIAGYMANNVRMSVDAESCPGGMTGATPERVDGGVPYARVWMRFDCPKEAGQFAVINEMFLDTVVDYELGGASGTFRFDADHTLMEAASPEFPRWVQQGFEAVALGWEHVVFLVILLLGSRGLREPGVFVLASAGALGLAALDVVTVSETVMEPLLAASLVAVAAALVLSFDLKWPVIAGFGALHGLGLASAMEAATGLVGFAVGALLAQALIVAVVTPLVRLVPRVEWARAAAGSAAAGVGLFALSQYVLGS